MDENKREERRISPPLSNTHVICVTTDRAKDWKLQKAWLHFPNKDGGRRMVRVIPICVKYGFIFPLGKI